MDVAQDNMDVVRTDAHEIIAAWMQRNWRMDALARKRNGRVSRLRTLTSAQDARKEYMT
jgi:hypothetical protein